MALPDANINHDDVRVFGGVKHHRSMCSRLCCSVQAKWNTKKYYSKSMSHSKKEIIYSKTELVATHMPAHLADNIKTAFINLNNKNVFCWTGSTLV